MTSYEDIAKFYYDCYLIRNRVALINKEVTIQIVDLYYDDEPSYLSIFDLIISMNKKYMFYAPSMGPFKDEKRNMWRKKILCKATAIVVRDPISYSYVNNFVPEKKPILTLDSALQHDIDLTSNKVKLDKYKELCSFIKNHKKCIGVTITDLSWHPKYSNNEIKIKIKETFTNVLKNFVQNGYGIVFIPQLYGLGNDYNLMKEYCFDEDNYFVICSDDEKYDTYFQQYVIGCMYAVIGMRYHSNIFSAKMGTPFISISYEQKMQGFMKKMELDRYCISLDKLSDEEVKEKRNGDKRKRGVPRLWHKCAAPVAQACQAGGTSVSGVWHDCFRRMAQLYSLEGRGVINAC